MSAARSKIRFFNNDSNVVIGYDFVIECNWILINSRSKKFKWTFFRFRLHRWYPFSQHLNSLKKCCEKGALLRKGGNCSEKWEKLWFSHFELENHSKPWILCAKKVVIDQKFHHQVTVNQTDFYRIHLKWLHFFGCGKILEFAHAKFSNRLSPFCVGWLISNSDSA